MCDAGHCDCCTQEISDHAGANCVVCCPLVDNSDHSTLSQSVYINQPPKPTIAL